MRTRRINERWNILGIEVSKTMWRLREIDCDWYARFLQNRSSLDASLHWTICRKFSDCYGHYSVGKQWIQRIWGVLESISYSWWISPFSPSQQLPTSFRRVRRRVSSNKFRYGFAHIVNGSKDISSWLELRTVSQCIERYGTDTLLDEFGWAFWGGRFILLLQYVLYARIRHDSWNRLIILRVCILHIFSFCKFWDATFNGNKASSLV